MQQPRTWTNNEPTHRATRHATSPPVRRAAEGSEGPGGLAAVPVGRRQDLAGLRDDTPSRRSASQAPPVGRAQEGPAGLAAGPGRGAGGAAAGPGRASRSTTPSLEARVWRSRGRPGPPAPGKPVGPQATQNRGAGPQARAPLDAADQPQQLSQPSQTGSATATHRWHLRSTCVRSRSARAARRSRRSSRSPRLRRRAGPRR